jgi:hypothetical protein
MVPISHIKQTKTKTKRKRKITGWQSDGYHHVEHGDTVIPALGRVRQKDGKLEASWAT